MSAPHVPRWCLAWGGAAVLAGCASTPLPPEPPRAPLDPPAVRPASAPVGATPAAKPTPPPPRVLQPGLPIGSPPADAAVGAPRLLVRTFADLPPPTHRFERPLAEVVGSETAFAPFAQALRQDLERLLAVGDFQDMATRASLVGMLGAVDLLQGRPDAALARADEVRALQPDAAGRMLGGLRLRALAQAARRHPLGTAGHAEAAAAAAAAEIQRHPAADIASALREEQQGLQSLDEGRLMTAIDALQTRLTPERQLARADDAALLLAARLALAAVLPARVGLLATYEAAMPADVGSASWWRERSVSLPPGLGHSPVVVGAWGGGVDPALFAGRMLTDAGTGAPRVIGFDRYGAPEDTPLAPLPSMLKARLPALLPLVKGLADQQAGVDSPESQQLRTRVARLKPEQMKPLVEDIRQAGDHALGSHAAGLLLDGNPHARLVVARQGFNPKLRPDPCPTPELARTEAANLLQTVQFLQGAGARVVLVEFGSALNQVEAALDECGIEPDDSERRLAAAAEIHQMRRAGWQAALSGAPEVLFVTAAPSQRAARQALPASLALPNLLVVDGWPMAGSAAGPARLVANGAAIEGPVPGGGRLALSGAGVAAAQVANLAAKLLARDARLGPEQLAHRIRQAAVAAPQGAGLLIDPRRTLQAAP